jgi:hypothetical protein
VAGIAIEELIGEEVGDDVVDCGAVLFPTDGNGDGTGVRAGAVVGIDVAAAVVGAMLGITVAGAVSFPEGDEVGIEVRFCFEGRADVPGTVVG